MNSPFTALAWEIGTKGKRSAWVVAGIVSLCAILNLNILRNSHFTRSFQDAFTPLFGLLMVVSFLLLMGIFNYTEFNSSKEWNGFPYRLFVLPLRTWQLVAMPMLLSVTFAELVYFAWVKLVWTREQIPHPAWFAVVLGAYVIFYQTVLWTLAGMRITRLIALSFGGLSSLAVAWLPFFGKEVPSPWLSENRLIPIVMALAALAFLVALVTVSKQRRGGGYRANWLKRVYARLADAMPMRTRDFASPSAAQFWFEWRRSGWLLPVCISFLLVIIGLASWFFRNDSRYTNYILGRLLLAPVVLAFVIGKGFIKCEFWTTSLALPAFVAVKPLSSEDYVLGKMKVAALSVAITWILIAGFLALWLPLWANTAHVLPILFQFQMFFPHTWVVILVLLLTALMVLTWRFMVSGFWAGLSGKALYYTGSLALQVILPAVALTAFGIWSDAFEAQMEKDSGAFTRMIAYSIGWILAILIVAKLWVAVFSWSKVSAPRTRQYLLVWIGGAGALVLLSILFRVPFDYARISHVSVLGALYLFPLARLGFAPASLANNRHR